jgi:hypothetical protein
VATEHLRNNTQRRRGIGLWRATSGFVVQGIILNAQLAIEIRPGAYETWEPGDLGRLSRD